ncbi:MAG: hypothetical protein KDK48_02475, partial [Chlamydiia bacterium]|nr:hypothetical protein [Chlamydiia bacterium]
MAVALIRAEGAFAPIAPQKGPSTRIAVGGSPCSGKTLHIRTMLGDSGMYVLDMDNYLLPLMKELPEGHDLGNNDLHEVAGRVLFSKTFRELTYEKPTGHILTQCLDTLEKVRRSVIRPAEEQRFETRYDDLYCSLSVALLRLLTRSSSGRDPLTPLDEVLQRFKNYRISRRHVLREVMRSRWIVEYTLIKNGRFVASKMAGQLWIANRRRFEKLMRPDLDKEIDAKIAKTLNKPITDELIERKVKKGLIAPSQIPSLKAWKGKTLHEAIQARTSEA